MLTPARKQRDEIRRQYPGVLLIMQIAGTYAAYEDDAAALTLHTRELVTVEPQRVTVPTANLEAVCQRMCSLGRRVGLCRQAP